MAYGGPTTLTWEIAEEICERLADGESMKAICRDPDMPNITLIYKWKRDTPWFDRMFKQARQDQVHTLVDEIIDIADDSTNDYVERETAKGTTIVLDEEHIRRSAIRIEARKWLAERMAPKEFGPKAELAVGNPDGSSLMPTQIILVAAPMPQKPEDESLLIEHE